MLCSRDSYSAPGKWKSADLPQLRVDRRRPGGIANSCPTPCSRDELARGSQTCVQLPGRNIRCASFSTSSSPYYIEAGCKRSHGSHVDHFLSLSAASRTSSLIFIISPQTECRRSCSSCPHNLPVLLHCKRFNFKRASRQVAGSGAA